MSFDNEDTIFRVVINHEEQYSIWPDYLEIPKGWREAGKTGKKPECLAYINEHWTDMRPLSLRKQMDAQASNSPRTSAEGVEVSGNEAVRSYAE